MFSQFGNKIKSLREQKNLLQRQVAAQVMIDVPMLSKIERGERRARKEQVVLFARILNGDKDELVALWLADQLLIVIEGEDLGLRAVQMVENKVRIELAEKR